MSGRGRCERTGPREQEAARGEGREREAEAARGELLREGGAGRSFRRRSPRGRDCVGGRSWAKPCRGGDRSMGAGDLLGIGSWRSVGVGEGSGRGGRDARGDVRRRRASRRDRMDRHAGQRGQPGPTEGRWSGRQVIRGRAGRWAMHGLPAWPSPLRRRGRERDRSSLAPGLRWGRRRRPRPRWRVRARRPETAPQARPRHDRAGLFDEDRSTPSVEVPRARASEPSRRVCTRIHIEDEREGIDREGRGLGKGARTRGWAEEEERVAHALAR